MARQTPETGRPKDSARSAFNKALCARVRELREAKRHPDGRAWTIEDMAELMRVHPETWRSYETRVPLPHYLLPRFSMACGRSIEYILTGREPRHLTTVEAAAS